MPFCDFVVRGTGEAVRWRASMSPPQPQHRQGKATETNQGIIFPLFQSLESNYYKNKAHGVVILNGIVIAQENFR